MSRFVGNSRAAALGVACLHTALPVGGTRYVCRIASDQYVISHMLPEDPTQLVATVIDGREVTPWLASFTSEHRSRPRPTDR